MMARSIWPNSKRKGGIGQLPIGLVLATFFSRRGGVSWHHVIGGTSIIALLVIAHISIALEFLNHSLSFFLRGFRL